MVLRRRIVTISTIGATLLALASIVYRVYAATSTANLNVSATVVRNCTIATAAVAFGSYDPVIANATTDLTANGSVTIACTKGTPATIGLSLGQNGSGSTRRMTDGSSNYLTYELYKDVTLATVWGNSGADLLDAGAAPSKAPRSFTSYGKVPAGQDVAAAAFTDVVVATVNF